jgi:hypothetical protein
MEYFFFELVFLIKIGDGAPTLAKNSSNAYSRSITIYFKQFLKVQ